jgi:hypothetical protein
MERKIGEIFELDGEWYQCIENDSCGECSLFTTECGSGTKSDLADKVVGQCSKIRRTDNKHVIFKKLEKVGEHYINNDRTYQLYKLPLNIEKLPSHTEGITLVRFDIVEIEIKQKDMEEKKLNLKPFDIQKAREGKPVCTRDGRKARIICFDRKHIYEGQDYSIVALINEGSYNETVCSYTKDGLHTLGKIDNNDLMMLPEKKEGWVNVYKNQIHDTPESAEEGHKGITDYIKTIRVEWED